MQANNVGTKIRPATLNEIFQFLSQFKPATCDFCGNKKWTVMLNTQNLPTIVDHNQYHIVKDGEAFLYMLFAGAITEKCILVRCQACGQVKQFSYSMLMDWVVKHRQTSGDGE